MTERDTSCYVVLVFRVESTPEDEERTPANIEESIHDFVIATDFPRAWAYDSGRCWTASELFPGGRP